MKKLWARLKHAAASLAGRTSAPAPAGGVKKPQVKAIKGNNTKSGFLASEAPAPQKSKQPKPSVLASLLRFTTAQGGNTKSGDTAPKKQKAGQSASPAKFTAKRKSNAPHAKQVAAKLKSNAAPQLKSTPQASTAPPSLELAAYHAPNLETAVTTAKPSSPGLDAALVNEMLSLQYRRCASSIDEQEVL